MLFVAHAGILEIEEQFAWNVGALSAVGKTMTGCGTRIYRTLTAKVLGGPEYIAFAVETTSAVLAKESTARTQGTTHPEFVFHCNFCLI